MVNVDVQGIHSRPGYGSSDDAPIAECHLLRDQPELRLRGPFAQRKENWPQESWLQVATRVRLDVQQRVQDRRHGLPWPVVEYYSSRLCGSEIREQRQGSLRMGASRARLTV